MAINMKYCNKCGVDVQGERERCPLCHEQLLSDDRLSHGEPFPLIKTVYKTHWLLFKMLIFLSLTASIVCVAINLLVPSDIWWSLFVVGGVACLWISLFFAARKQKSIAKSIIYQTIIVSGFSAAWDAITGWRGWSIDYVIPISFTFAMIAMAVLIKIFHFEIKNLLIHILTIILFGIIPIIFYVVGCLSVPYPSIICVSLSLIFLSALIIFRGHLMRDEIGRRFHV